MAMTTDIRDLPSGRPASKALAIAFALILVLAVALLVVIDRPAHADEPNCTAPGTQAEMTECARRALDAAELRLNEVYTAARARAQELDDKLRNLGPVFVGVEKALIEAQQGWIGYRDGHCAVEGFSARGGTMEPMLVAQCMAELTERRAAELDEAIRR